METLHIVVGTETLIRVLLLGFMSFLIAMLLTPLYTTLAYTGQWWKKPRTTSTTGEKAKMFTQLHAAKHRRHIPTMAGIVFVAAIIIVTLLFTISSIFVALVRAWQVCPPSSSSV